MIQVAVYPIGTNCVGEKVMKAINAIKEMNLETFTTPMSTTISCELDEGLQAIGKLYEVVANDGQAVMNVTFSNCCGL
jgi:uncharacterized protein YqgV (UPF0045/DUF77 family)